MTPTSPTPIPAISRPPVAAPLPVAEALAAEFVAVAFAVERSSTWPKVGSGTSPFTAQPLTVAKGHEGAFLEGVYSELFTPVGDKVAQWLFRFV